MKVYELIQELTQYSAESEVEFSVKATFDTEVDVDLEGEENQEVDVEFDEYVSFDDIDDEEFRKGRIVINLEY